MIHWRVLFILVEQGFHTEIGNTFNILKHLQSLQNILGKIEKSGKA